MKLTELFPGRVSTALAREKIHTLEELLRHSVADLLTIPEFGPRSLEEVQGTLAGRGLYLSKKGVGLIALGGGHRTRKPNYQC